MTYAPNPYSPQYPGGYPYPPPQGYGPPPRTDAGPRRYSMWAGYVLFLSPALWRDAGRKWRGIGFWFTFILLLLAWIPSIVKMHVLYSAFLQNDAAKITSQVPPITISNGVVSTPVPQPHTISDPETGRPFIVIDTTGETTEPPGDHSALLTSNKLIMRNSQFDSRTTDLSQIQSFYVDSKDVTRWLEMGPTLIWAALFPTVVVFNVLGRLLIMLALAGIGSMFSSSARAQLSYAALLRLTAISLVPITLIDVVLSLTGVNVGCWGALAGWALTLIPLYFAVKANAPETPAFGGPPGPAGFPMYQTPPGYGAPPAGYSAPPSGYPGPSGYAPPPPPPG